MSILDQDIDVSANAADVDAGRSLATLRHGSGYLNDGDSARFDVSFLDGAGKDLIFVSLGPVTTAERGGKTGLLSRAKTVSFRVRTISAALYMIRDANNGGAYNDGYADSLQIVLRGPVVVTTTVDSGTGSLQMLSLGPRSLLCSPTVSLLAARLRDHSDAGFTAAHHGPHHPTGWCGHFLRCSPRPQVLGLVFTRPAPARPSRK